MGVRILCVKCRKQWVPGGVRLVCISCEQRPEGRNNGRRGDGLSTAEVATARNRYPLETRDLVGAVVRQPTVHVVPYPKHVVFTVQVGQGDYTASLRGRLQKQGPLVLTAAISRLAVRNPMPMSINA